jgi:hypothetical protein
MLYSLRGTRIQLRDGFAGQRCYPMRFLCLVLSPDWRGGGSVLTEGMCSLMMLYIHLWLRVISTFGTSSWHLF